QRLAEEAPTAPSAGPTPERRFLPLVTPWQLDVSIDLEPLIEDDMRGRELKRAGLRSAAAAVRELLFRTRGVPLPACRIVVSEELPARHVVLSIHELPARVITLP